MASKNNAAQTLKIQQESIDKLAEALKLLSSRIKALQEDGKSLIQINEMLGDELGVLARAYIDTTEESAKLVKSHKKVAESDSEVSKAIGNVTNSLGKLETAYSKVARVREKAISENSSVRRKYEAEQSAADKEFNQKEAEASQKRVNEAKSEAALQQQIAKKAAEEEQNRINKRETLLNGVRSKRLKREREHTDEMIREQKRLMLAHDDSVKKQKADYKELTGDLQRTFKDSLKLQDAQRKLANANIDAAERAKFFGKSFREAFSPQAIGRAIASIVKFIGIYQIIFGTLNTLKQLFVGSAEAFIKFEDAIGKLNSVTLATEEQSKALASSIRTVAVETRFTATQVAELATSLAKLGATASEIPNLIGPIAGAAQATGESLDKVGETILKVNNQFGISSLESAVTAATLVSTLNESALSLETFNTAIQYIGPIAAQVGLTFGETAEYLKTLADNGFTASRIGTGLRSIFLELKKPGEDINKTLDDLAKKNISVAEAMELVGKRAAAQLLTILRTKESFDAQRTATEALGTSLAAAAAQMSTFAGKIDILKSAFEEFRLKLGEAIVNTEFFLELIGLLSDDSEALARGYELINRVAQKNTDALSDNIDAVLGGANAYTTIINTLDDTGIYMTKFRSTFNSLSNNLNRAGTRLTVDEKFEAFAISISGGQSALEDFLRSIGKLEGANLKLITEIGTSVKGGGDEIEDQSLAILGYFRRINDGVESFRRAGRAEQYRLNIQKEYREELEAIEKLGVENLNAQQRAVNLETQIALKRTEIIKLQKAEESKGAGASSERLLRYEAEIAGLDAYMQRLSEFNADLVNEDDGRLKSEMAMFNKQKKSLENRREEIENDARQSQKYYEEEVNRINSIADLKKASFQNEVLQNEVEKERTEELRQLRKQYLDDLTNLTMQETELAGEADKLWAKYRKIWAGNESYLLTVSNAQEQFSLSLTKLVQNIVESKKDATWTPEELGSQLLARATGIVNAYSNSLKVLEDQSNDSAYSQYQLGLRQREYFEQTKKLIGEFEQEYTNYFNALVAIGSSEEQAARILEPMRIALDGMNALFNNANQEILTDKQMKELGDKFKVLSDDVILSVDTTLKDTLALAIDTALDGLQKFNDTAFQNTKDRLDKEKEELKSRFDFEDDILKSKLDNQLLTEAEYRAQVEKNRKAEVQAQNQIDRQIFEAEQKKARQDAMIDYLSALNSIVPNLIVTNKEGDPISISLKAAISAAMATASYGMEVRAINQRQFFPTKFAEGGMVYGPSHEEGGVPFTVGGYGGYEMEGGEYIVNKKAANKYRSLLDKINDYGRSTRNYALGGMVENPVLYQKATLEFLSSIAESNIDIVGKLDKPVRSFVSSDDLRSDENARRIKSRNSQL